MKTNLRNLLEEIRHKALHLDEISHDLHKLSDWFKLHYESFETETLHKITDHLKKINRPSDKMLDTLSMFAGFQSWEDFRKTIHGETDGQINFNSEQKQPTSSQKKPIDKQK